MILMMTELLGKITWSSRTVTLLIIQQVMPLNRTTKLTRQTAYYFAFSSPELSICASYSVYTGGTSTSANNNGLYTGGTYSGGTLKKTFTISSKIMGVTF
jgi:trimeric autotransporter adhesin